MESTSKMRALAHHIMYSFSPMSTYTIVYSNTECFSSSQVRFCTLVPCGLIQRDTVCSSVPSGLCGELEKLLRVERQGRAGYDFNTIPLGDWKEAH